MYERDPVVKGTKVTGHTSKAGQKLRPLQLQKDFTDSAGKQLQREYHESRKHRQDNERIELDQIQQQWQREGRRGSGTGMEQVARKNP